MNQQRRDRAEAEQTAETVYTATVTGRDGQTLVGVYKTLEGAKLACGDFDRYMADDQDGDDRLNWAQSDEKPMWAAIAEDEQRYVVEAVGLLD